MARPLRIEYPGAHYGRDVARQASGVRLCVIGADRHKRLDWLRRTGSATNDSRAFILEQNGVEAYALVHDPEISKELFLVEREGSGNRSRRGAELAESKRIRSTRPVSRDVKLTTSSCSPARVSLHSLLCELRGSA